MSERDATFTPEQEKITDTLTHEYWEPKSEPQVTYAQSPIPQILYGGAAYGGKSMMMVGDALEQVSHPDYLAVLFRRTEKQLAQLIAYAKKFYPPFGGKPTAGFKNWEFPSGSQIILSSMEHDHNVEDWFGIQMTLVGYDELVTFTENQYKSLVTWNRVSSSELMPQMKSTTNPWPAKGGDGIEWIMDWWNIPANVPVTEPIVTWDGEMPSRHFIPATYRDNPLDEALIKQWLRNQELTLSPDKLKAYLDGVWGVSPGQFFHKFDVRTHVKEPDYIKAHVGTGGVVRAGGLDYGSGATSATCYLWGVRTLDNTIYIEREYYVKGKPTQYHVPAIRSLTPEGHWPMRTYADPSMFKMQYGRHSYTDKTISQDFQNLGMMLLMGQDSHQQGYDAIQRALYYDTEDPVEEFHRPQLYISSQCKNLIRELQSAQMDDNNPEEIANDGAYHAIATLRYLMMHLGRPRHQEPKRDTEWTTAGVLQRLKKKRRMGRMVA